MASVLRSLPRRATLASLARLPSPAPSSALASRAFTSSLARRESEEERSARLKAEYDAVRVTEDHPSHASVDEAYKFSYDPKELGDDLGHRTTGPGHGKHTKRTLASLSMDGKVAVVTGAARGLGNMFARTFVESGSSKVAIIDLHQEDAERAAKEMVDWFVKNGDAEEGEIEAMGYGCDVSDEASVQKTFQDIKARYGRIDCLVTAAGIVENFGCLEYPTDKLNKLWAININGTYFCAREAAKIMLETETKGNIIMVGSMSSSVVNVPQAQAPYNASKAAVRHLASSMAVELATKGIRVNCLSPGYMATSLTKAVLAKDTTLRDTWVSLTPMGRMGEPEDLKGAIIYLGSDAAAFTTGIDLRVEGGYTSV